MVTADHKYLFYTTGTKPDYSDTGIFYGSPSEPAEYTVIVTAADKEDAKGFGLFKLIIRDE